MTNNKNTPIQHAFQSLKKRWQWMIVSLVSSIFIVVFGIFIWRSIPLTLNPNNQIQQESPETKFNTIEQNTATWTLVSGDPNPSQDCSALSWRGSAEIKGWYVWEPVYVENYSEQWLFKIAMGDTWKLPLDTSRRVMRLIDATSELEEKLKNASETSPETIIIKNFALPYSCEGVPYISINEDIETYYRNLQ